MLPKFSKMTEECSACAFETLSTHENEPCLLSVTGRCCFQTPLSKSSLAIAFRGRGLGTTERATPLFRVCASEKVFATEFRTSEVLGGTVGYSSKNVPPDSTGMLYSQALSGLLSWEGMVQHALFHLHFLQLVGIIKIFPMRVLFNKCAHACPKILRYCVRCTIGNGQSDWWPWTL